jgi:hypothetical protein
VQDQFGGSIFAVCDKSDLSVKGIKEIFAKALWKYLVLIAVYLGKQVIAVPDNVDRYRTHFVTSKVSVACR